MEKILDVSRKDILAGEFVIYTALEFTLYVPLWEVMPHLERVIEASAVHKTLEEYVDENTFFVHLFKES
ncbi:hypothetical protein HKX48_001432 [Thoreauomyces humboldtii]|nr:hypothetical protein HKX48_001432 [Thoreauomyces humboldtii]